MRMRYRIRILLILPLFILLYNQGFAQNNYRDAGVDKLFEKARTEAFDGNYSKAREICSVILERTPDYHDVRILIARTYAWESRYDEARKELNTVLSREPQYRDALSALFDVEYWSENYRQALKVADRGLDRYPSNEAFIVMKARALIRLERFDNASVLINTLEDLNPSHSEIESLRERIGRRNFKNTVTGSYTYETFSHSYDDTHLGYLQWNRRTTLGPVIGRVNFSRRFERYGIQPEIDWYPRITGGLYGYVNYGYTSSSIFPRHRIGAEIYRRLPYELEGSIGFRHLNFSATDNITMVTGSLTKYFRNYYFSLRSYITPHSEGELSRSFILTIRRYFDNPDNYIHASGGFGVSPQDRTYQSVSGNIFALRSQSAGLGIRKNMRYNLNLIASIDYSHQELLFSPGDYVNIYSINIGIGVKF